MGVENHQEFFEFLKFAPDGLLFTYFHTTYTVQVLDLVQTAMASIVLHEYFVHFAAEMRTWKLLFEGRFMPARMAVIIIRYSWIGAFVNCLIFLHGAPKPHNCILHFRLVYGLYCILWAFSGSIFLMRLNIIFGRQRPVMIVYIILWLAGLGCWIFVVTRLGAEPLPSMLHQPYGPVCVTKRFPKIGALGWGASIMFDSCVFLGTLYRFHVTAKAQDKTAQLRSRKWLFRSNLYYFGSSIFFNMACFLSNLLVNDVVLSQVGTPIAFAMHTVTASRLVFNAKGWARGDTLGDEDDVILNTFNRNRRENPVGRIRYTVDETIITSVGGIDAANDEGSIKQHQDDDLSHDLGSATARDSDPERREEMKAFEGLSKKFYENNTYIIPRSSSLLRNVNKPMPDINQRAELHLREMPDFQHVSVPSVPPPAHVDNARRFDIESQHMTEQSSSGEYGADHSPVPPSYSHSPERGTASDSDGESNAGTVLRGHSSRQHPYISAAPPRSPQTTTTPLYQSMPHESIVSAETSSPPSETCCSSCGRTGPPPNQSRRDTSARDPPSASSTIMDSEHMQSPRVAPRPPAEQNYFRDHFFHAK